MTNIENKSLNIEEIKKRLKHRYPMLLVDKVIDYEVNKSIHALKNVTFNEPHFQGHFPELAVFPGVLVIEAMAQATGLLSSLSFEVREEQIFYLATIDECRFRQKVVPGDTMNIFIDAIGEPRHNMWRFNCRSEVERKVIASAKIMCACR